MKIIFVFFLSFLFPFLGTQTDIQDVADNQTNETSFESALPVKAVMDVAINDTPNEIWEVLYYGASTNVPSGTWPLNKGTDCSTGIKARLLGGDCILTLCCSR